MNPADPKRGLEINPLEGSLPLRTPAFPLYGPRPVGRAESQEVIITRRRRQMSGTRLPFTPYVGGENSNELFIQPGTVTFCRIGSEDREAGTDEEAHQTIPVFPTIDNTPINDATPPSFSLSGRSSAAIWLCCQRTKCGTEVPTGVDPEARLVIVDRGDKPDRVEDEIHRLVCEMDFDTAGGGEKSITNEVLYRQSDHDVWYLCVSDDSSTVESDPFGSDFSEFSSGELSDVPNDSSDSGSDENCPWEIDPAAWVGKRRCYPRFPGDKAPVIFIALGIKISAAIRANCRNIYAYISVNNGGLPKESYLGPGESITGAGEIKVPLTKRANQVRVEFYFVNPPCKVLQEVTVRIASEDKDPPSSDNECCGEDKAGEKTVSIGMWPGWCEYGSDGSSCGTTLVP